MIAPRRVVFTWGWEGNEIVPPGSSTVEIDLEPDGTGTRLRLVHRGLPEEAVPTHAEGWDYFLPRLTNVAERRDAGAGQQSAAKMEGLQVSGLTQGHVIPAPRKGP